MSKKKHSAEYLNSGVLKEIIAGYNTFVNKEGKLNPFTVAKTLMHSGFGSAQYISTEEDEEALQQKYYAHYYTDDNEKTTMEVLRLSQYWQDASIYYLSFAWMSEGKTIYRPTNEFAEFLLNTDQLAIRSADLKHLPFSSFYIDLRGVSIFFEERITGVFIGVNDVQYSGNIRKEDTSTTHILYHATSIEEKDVCFSNEIILSKQMDDEFGIMYTKEFVPKEYQNCYLLKGNDIPQSERVAQGPFNIFRLERFILQFIQYLISDKPDIQESSRSIQHRFKDEKHKNEDCQKEYEVGVRVGQQLAMIKKARSQIIPDDSENPNKEPGTHASPIPHMRKAHWHRYYYGPGKKEIKTVWVLPVLVNGAMNDLSITVHNAVEKEKDGYKGELAVEEYLKSLGIKYQAQYHVRETNRRYDFCVQKNGRKMMIEFDGEQHFKPVAKFGGKDQYLKQREIDKEKTEWCRKKKIPLLRIRYDQAGSIPEMIDDYLKKPQKYLKQVNTYLSDQAYYSVCKTI